ncbi:MAG TPA: glycine cleavage system protein GcvH [Candidatus Thioglobus sp.]|jgi:glycine cleavage system H protein|nr:glycine cleavage system protein GcvH [Candidatus Thioglobus sp.]HIL21469.1 glycine cleavage system protein GcvH [Candidatus Thioglobus sp.]
MNEIRGDRQYAETHEWVLDNGDGTYTLGISDYAQESLGDLVFVELPDLGDLISSQEGLCVVESVKSASDVHAPVDLKVLEVNESLDDEPELVNSDCYDAGWLIKFNADSIDGLMDSDAYIATLDLD